MALDPLKRSEEVRKVVVKNVGGTELRKYYRFRPSRFYGGSAVADSLGCNLACGFCWSWRANTAMDRIGTFYTPREVAERLISIAKRCGYRIARISGGEPTLSMNHLVKVLEHLEEMGFRGTFVLETNGILLGHDPSYAKALSRFRFLHVRVSIKGCNEKEFSIITGADPKFFEYQLKALKNLLDAGVSTHPAVVVSFCSRESLVELYNRLMEIEPELARGMEEEYVILYPHVVELMRRRGLRPRVAWDPRRNAWVGEEV